MNMPHVQASTTGLGELPRNQMEWGLHARAEVEVLGPPKIEQVSSSETPSITTGEVSQNINEWLRTGHGVYLQLISPETICTYKVVPGCDESQQHDQVITNQSFVSNTCTYLTETISFGAERFERKASFGLPMVERESGFGSSRPEPTDRLPREGTEASLKPFSIPSPFPAIQDWPRPHAKHEIGLGSREDVADLPDDSYLRYLTEEFAPALDRKSILGPRMPDIRPQEQLTEQFSTRRGRLPVIGKRLSRKTPAKSSYPRRKISSAELATLEELFVTYPSPSTEVVKRYATQLGRTEGAVRCWLTKRRCK
jgi:Homeodomain